jgi:hypothetical protein
MSTKAKILGTAATLGLAAACYALPAGAVAVTCKDTTLNYMNVDSAYVSSCINSGVGNIGNGINDDFLNNGGSALGWADVGDGSYTQGETTDGTFSFSSSLWNDYGSLAIGFKFGTGNTPDEWFVYELQHLVSSGFWDLILSPTGKGGGLSHISVYGSGSPPPPPPGSVPEPTTLSLLGLGLLGLGLARRKKKA